MGGHFGPEAQNLHVTVRKKLDASWATPTFKHAATFIRVTLVLCTWYDLHPDLNGCVWWPKWLKSNHCLPIISDR